MTEYLHYLESGPKRRKTMVHLLDLLGCIANGPTTEEALEATPEAIRAYLRFLRRRGEAADPEAAFETKVAEHITEGEWLGNGSPSVLFGPDVRPVSEAEVEIFLGRFHGLREELSAWAEAQGDRQLDAEPPAGGRTARSVLLHVMAVPGAYLSPVLGGVSGFSRLHTAAERGDVSLAEGLRRVEAMASDLVRATTPEQRAAVIERPKDVRTLRRAIRRMLEHDWEHLAELSRRPGGPAL